jgi:aminoglycoside phosphotransferase
LKQTQIPNILFLTKDKECTHTELSIAFDPEMTKETLPEQLEKIIKDDYFVEMSLGESASHVFQVHLKNGENAYLKTTTSTYVIDEIHQEIRVLDWLKGKLNVPKPLLLIEEAHKAFYLISEVPGMNLADACKSLTTDKCLKMGARYMRQVHSINIGACPFNRQLSITMKLAKANLEAGLVSTKEIYEDLCSRRGFKEDLVFTHGDFCFPNLIYANDTICGTIDLSRAGIADRYQDISLFLRSFQKNLAPADTEAFLLEYGLIDKIDPGKLDFYRTLDEFF